jgi:hypothetical protein
MNMGMMEMNMGNVDMNRGMMEMNMGNQMMNNSMGFHHRHHHRRW